MGIKRRSTAPAAADYLDDDDDTVTTLRSKRRRDEEPAPARTRKRAVEVEDIDEDEEDEDEEEERPRARPKTAKASSRRPRDEEEEDDLDDDEEEDEDEVPARTSVIQSGRKAAKRVMAQARSGFADEFRFSDEPALVKFPQDEPFASYSQHWIERAGKKSFICLKGIDPKGCPLCKAGDNPRSVAAYNVVVLSEDGDILDPPMVKALMCGPRLFNQVEAEHDGRYGPIDSHYWTLSKSGKKGSASTSIKPVKERDLEEDWGIKPARASRLLTEAKLYTPAIIQLPSRKELIDVAREMNDGD